MEMTGLLHASAASSPDKDHSVHWIRGWVGPTAGMDALHKTNIICPSRESNYDLEGIQHEELVDFSEQNYSNLFVKWNVPKATGNKMRVSNKLCFNLLNFYTLEQTITYFVN
jgi:hypothetical protein